MCQQGAARPYWKPRANGDAVPIGCPCQKGYPSLDSPRITSRKTSTLLVRLILAGMRHAEEARGSAKTDYRFDPHKKPTLFGIAIQIPRYLYQEKATKGNLDLNRLAIGINVKELNICEKYCYQKASITSQNNGIAFSSGAG